MNTKQKRTIIAITTLLIIFAIGCVVKIFATEDVDDLADVVAQLTEEEKKDKERDDNPETDSYLVTDSCISRVLPNTSISEFLSNFGSEKLKLYKDKTCQEEVTSGDVCSGMYAKYETNGRVFEISVLGDINEKVEEKAEKTEQEISEEEITEKLLKGDSNLNEIECTRVIRAFLGNENWKIEDEGEFKSADVTCNQKIDEQDIDSIVDYIVFGEIEAPSVEKIEEPSLKVSEGFKNEDGSFEGRATVKLTQNFKNGTKNIYRISRYEEEYIEIANEEEIELTQPGTYTIIAYTYGESGNKSKGEIKTVVIKPGIYKLTLISGENIVSVKGTGNYKIGDIVKIDATVKENEPGYTYTWGAWTSDNQELVENQAIKNSEITMPKGNVTLTAHAVKETVDYSIKYNLNGGELPEGVTNPETYTIETTTITLNNPSKPGYKFIGWTGSNGDEPETALTIEVGSTGDKEYIANYEELPNAEYIVEHYKEDLTGSSYELVEIERYSDKIGTTIDAKEKGYIKEYKGFSYDKENADNKLVGEVVEAEKDNEKLTLKIYYKRNLYHLILNKNENIEKVTATGKTEEKSEGIVIGTYKYQQPVEIEAKLKEEQGYRYEFDIWKSSDTKLLTHRTNKKSEFTMPAGNLILEAIAKKYAREDTAYNIEYYYQENGTYPAEPRYTVEGTGTTGATKTISELEKQPTIAGYKFDEKNANNILEGTIEGNGSLVLKVYFKQQFKVSYLPGVHGKFATQTTTNLNYGSATPQFEGELKHEEGYEFAGWDKEVSENVTGNIEYTATWEPKIYKIEYNLNGGELPEGKTNPTTYTIEDETITVHNPVKNGYRFIGWTGEDVEEATQELTIETGNTGDRIYTANWEAIEYTITYELNEGTLLEGKTNPEKYTIETESFTLNNPVKEGYTFLGWTGTGLEGVTENVTIESGNTGNRAYTANWERNTGVKYTVEYYAENIEGTEYELKERNELSGTTEDHVSIEIKEFAGFTFDGENENNKLEGEIAGDGSLVLKAYYTRNSYNITLYTQKANNIQKLILNKTEENIADNDNIRISKTFKFEAPIEINAEVKETLGYTTTFTKWESSNTELMADQANKKVNFTMPAGDITLEAKATKTAKLSNYTVEYYYEGENGYPETATSSVTRQKLTEEIAVIEDSDKIAQRDGYEYDETAENKLTGEVLGDGSLVLKIHFRRKSYNVTLTAGENIQEVIGQGTYKYGEKVTIDAVLKSEEGYVISFTKWIGSYDNLLDNKENIQTNFTMPYDNVTLTATANKQAREDIAYTVEYYYQEDGEYSNTANDRDVRTDGTTGQEVSIKEEDKKEAREGYIFDETKTENLRGIVPGDGSLVLKVYFKQQFKVSYLPGVHGKFATQITTNLNYGSATPQFEGELKHEEGYEFAGWDKEVSENVTGNIEYTATWNASIYTIEYNLNGGELPEGKTNPTTYTVEDEAITLNNPVKNGYRFIGWTGEDVEEATQELTIETGNTGDRIYTANWEAIEYTITYELNEGTLLEGKTNPEKYTIETESFTLNNPVKEGYTFLGWTGTGLEGVTEDVTVESGNTGNRAYTANWERNTGVKYTVEYYTENIEGTEYELKERNELSGTTEDHVSIEIKEFAGFTFDVENENNKLEGNIAGDGSLVLKAYYTRNSYRLTLVKGKDIAEVTGENTYKYEQTVNIDAKVAEENGYTITFAEWLSSNESLLANQTSKEVEFIMPAGDITLEAKATKTAKLSNYKVEYYYEGENGYSETATSSVTRQKLTEEIAVIEDSDKIAQRDGYEYDETAENKLTGEVLGDGSLVLKVHFRRKSYSVTLTAGENIQEVIGQGTYKYGEKVTIDAVLKSEEGYVISFTEWIGSYDNLLDNKENIQTNFTMPYDNVTLTATANKQAREDIAYTVEYYYQENGEYSNTANDRDIRTDGTTGQEVSIKEEDKKEAREGYIFDETKTENLRGIVPGDGSLVLKVYFKQQFKVSYLPGNHGTFKTQTTQNLDYGSATPQFEGELKHEEGYEFAGWDKKVSENVTGNIEYTATWETKIYKIEYNLNGGELPEGKTNPTTYTVEDEAITLNNPVKNGYRFIGWTGEDIEEATQELTIETGNTGDRIYTANWEAIEYTITYELNGGELLEGKTNPAKYTIETESFTLNNPVKIGYTFLGWTGTDLEGVTNNVTVESGSTGNIQYIANWARNTGIKYTVEYYVENIEGTEYELKERNELSGTTEDHVSIEIKEFAGFTFDGENENNKLEGEIAGDGSLVLKAYYTRNSYKLTLYTQKANNIQKLILNKTEENITDNDNIRISKTFKFEAPIEINAEEKETLGYTTTFTKWESSNTELMADQANKKVEFTMPAGDLTLTATAVRNANQADYAVEYYYENVNGEYAQLADRPSIIRTDKKTDEIAEITEEDKEEKFAGYEYNEELSANEISKKVNADGSTTLKVYFSRKTYTVTLVAGEEVNEVTGTYGEQSGEVITVKYGKEVSIKATGKTEQGYTFKFNEWTGTYDNLLADKTSIITTFEMPADNVTLTATGEQIANTNTQYKIGYYYQEKGEYPEEANTTEPKEDGTTGAYAKVKLSDIEVPTGYALDEVEIRSNGTVNDDNELYGRVEADGSLELKVYFKQQFTVTYQPGLQGTFKTKTTGELDYGTLMPSFQGELIHKAGYEFAGWDKEIAETVTESIEYIATWKASTYTIEYNLNGGELPEGKTNPTTYTVEDEKIILNNPVKNGYRFIGWTGEDIEEATQELTIETGNTGDRIYTANWEAIEYTITYELNGGELLEGKTNPAKYTIETESFTLNNPVKIGYTFLGWTGTELEGVTEDVTVESGNIGNREYIANWERNTGIRYTVEYYVENIEGTEYELKEKNELSGTTEDTVNIEIKEFAGFTFDGENENNKLEGNIAGDGSLVLKAYYTRNSYRLTLVKGEDIAQVTGENTYKYEQTVNIDAKVVEENGYTITFTEWLSNNESLLANQSSKEVEFTMPAGDITLTATANRVSNIAGYTVEYYYEGENGYPERPEKTDNTRTGLVAETGVIEENDKISEKIGYEYDETAENKLTGTIVADGSLVLKVYFRKSEYNLTIVAGDGISQIKLDNLTAGKEETLSKTYKYGENITIDATCGEEIGYTIEFGKWKSNNTNLMEDNTGKQLEFTMPAGNLSLTAMANKTPLETTYKVEYYYQENGEYASRPKESDTITRTGTTGQEVSLTGADKEAILEGYAYDNNAEGKIESSRIAGDGSTVLKAYFKQQFTVTYKPGEYGTFVEQVINGVDYGTEVPEYTGNYDGSEGYIFDSWTPEKEEGATVTENLSYTAQWKKMALPIITHSPTTWTNQNVTVTIEKPEGYEKHNIEYSVANQDNWQGYTKPFEVEENCVVYARLKEGSNKGDIEEHTIDNIDKIAPEFAETNINTELTDQATITIRATDSLSGIVEYGIKGTNDTEATVYKCSNTNETEISFDEIYENGIYEVYLKDAAGNIAKGQVPVIHIQPYNVAKIVEAPEGYEHLIGTEYETLELALSTSDEAATLGNVKIEIIHNIHNEANTIQNGRDYTINLNGYKVNNSEGKETLTVDGKLKIVDEKNSMTEIGKVSSPFGTAINITLKGELTLGEDDGKTTPNIYAPIIEGGEYGIAKEIDYDAEKVYDENKEKDYYPEGIFNFYDGKIIGGTLAMMLQKVDDTPLLYDPTVTTNTVTGNQESTLAIVSGIEAVIGKKRYMLLEDAIDDANNVIGDSNTQVEITIVRDLAKDAEHKVAVDSTKNIKLDLNGHVFTTTANDYVLENYGKLEIYDSTSDCINVDLTQAVAKGDYYFEQRPEGGLISNNIGVDNSTAHSITEVDLTGKKGMYKVVINAAISSESGYDYGYITVRTDDKIVEYSESDGRKVFVSGSEDQEYCFDLEGGEKYYIQFGYRKDSGTNSGNDCFVIKDMNMLLIPGTITSSTASTILNGFSEKSEIVYEDIDLSKAVAKGDYYFETRAEGGLISNNTGVHDSTAHSLLELDLTGKEGVYEISTNVTISSEDRYDFGYITIRTDDKIVEYNEENGRKVYISGSISDQEYKIHLNGGKKYYIQFGYRKDSSSDRGSDCFIVKNMKIGKRESAGSLTITSGTYECTKRGDNSDSGFCGVIQNESNLYVNGGEIKATNDYTAGVYNGKIESGAYVEINGGKINTYSNSIFNKGVAVVNGGILYSNGGYDGNGYYACIRNKSILNILGENAEITGYIAVYTNGITEINAGKFNYTNYGINNSGTTNINGGNFTLNERSSSYDKIAVYNNNNGDIKINNVKIISGDYAVSNHEGNIEIDNIDITSVNSDGVPTVTTGLYNNSNGKIIFNNGNIHVNHHAGYNMDSGTIEINGGTLKTYSSDYSTVINSNDSSSSEGIIKMTGGTITGPANGIYNLNKGKVIITGGLVESRESVAIYNKTTYNIVTIGSNDEEVSSEEPVIKSYNSNAISNRLGTFNFYDGVLIGKENVVIDGVLNDIPEQTELVKELKDDNLQYVTLGIPTDGVAKIAEADNPDVSSLNSSYYKLKDGYYHFITLNSAVEASSTSNATTIELIDDPWVYRKITVDEGQDITIKFRDKTMYLYAPLNFENNGTLNFINENAEDVTEEERAYGNIKANGGLLIKNNENAKMELDNISISYISSGGSSSNIRKLIDNYGILNINNSKYYGTTGEDRLYVYGIYNEANGTLNINNTTIHGKFEQPIINIANDKIDEEGNTIYAITIRNSTISIGGYGYGVQNTGLGTMLIEDTISTSYYDISNNTSGKMIIRNSNISANSNGINNRDTGYIEIDNSIINCTTYNRSSGKILIKGTASNLKDIENRNVNGIVEIQAGTISYNYDSIENSGILIISGGNVISGTSDYSAIINKSGAKATISGSDTIITGPYGIKNDGELIIKSGKITGTRYRGINNTNKLTLGDKDGNIEYSLVVNGKTDGIYNSGTFNFYDGIIEGNETVSIRGVIPSETEEDSLRVIYKGEYTFDDKTENGYSVASGREISVLEQVNVAYVVSKDKNYASLEKALADTEDSDTIKIIHDVSINGVVDSLVIPEEKNITLDLNGFNIVAGNNKTIVNNGTLRIIDGTSHEDESGNIIEGKFVSGGNTILENNGTATIENGSYELTLGGNKDNYYNMFANTGTLEISSKGTFKAQGTYSRVIYNTTGDVLINNSILTATGNNTDAIYNETGTINIEIRTIAGQVNNNGTGTINIKEGTINGQVYNYSEGTINMSGGTIQANSNTYSINNTSNGIINITDGTIRGISNDSNGIINIKGGTIKGDYYVNGVLNKSTGTINIDGTSLSEENAIQIVNVDSTNTYGVYNYYNASGTINIKGYVNIDITSKRNGYTAYGIYNKIGTINIGDSENITNNVKVSSSDYGIYGEGGTINYYGGTITAPTAFYSYINNVPEEYDIIRSIDESNNEVYEIGKTQEIVSVGETTYDTLEEAILNNDSGTIKLLKDIVYATSEKQTIGNNKSFVLDLNGHSIKLHNSETFITNYGTFKITDNTEAQNGKIYGYATEVIRNEGKFEMAGGTITIAQRNSDKIIYNTGEGIVKVTGGTLYSKATDTNHKYYIIYSDNNNDIEVTGGTFSLYGIYSSWSYSYSYAIYTESENTTINVSGGNFKHERSGYTYMIYMNSSGNLNVSGNVTSNCIYGIYMDKSGIVNISEEADLNNSEASIYISGNYSGEVNINGGTVKAIGGRKSATATLTKGNVTGEVSNFGTVDVYEGVNINVSGNAIQDCTNVNIHEGATVTSTSNAISSCTNVNIYNGTINGSIYMRGGILNMASGSITGKDYGIRLYNTSNQTATVNIIGGTVTATAGPGILIESGTLNLGEDTGGYPSTEVPTITGSTYGVKNDGGTFNFYDGILTGTTYATSGTVTKTPEMFKVLYSADGTVAILGIEATFEQVATVNGTYYDDLASAIDAAAKINGTVELCKDIVITREVEIPEGNTVTIDLAGFSIIGYTESGAIFTNNGTLSIIDSRDDGTNTNVYSSINNHNGTAIINNGTLTLGNDDENVNTNSPRIIGLSTAIENNGSLEFLDGQIGTITPGTIVTGSVDVTLPTGYEVAIEGNNYILVQEN